jgi:outer membrane protein assembly factor BamB
MLRRYLSALTITTAILLTVPPAFSADGTWPAFLGAGASGVQVDKLPSKWDAAKNLKWSAVLPGHGQSSPVVWNDRVFLTSVEGPKKEVYHVVCLDVVSGKERWRQQVKNSQPVENSLYVSRSAPTPVVDSQHLITQFESGDCVCWSHDGKLVWQRDLATDYGPIKAQFGLGASPCQTAESVFILMEHDGPSCLVSLDKKTGKQQWKAERSSRQSWSSPAIVQVDGKPHVVVSSQGSVDGYDPANGNVFWSFKEVGGNTGVTPIDCGKGSFLIGASAGRQGENAEAAKSSNAMIQVVREGDKFVASRKWIAKEASPSWASPIIHDGVAYWMNRTGVMSAFDATTGQPLYTKRAQQSSWATPLAAGGRVFWFGKDGLCTVIESGKEFNVLAENQIWSKEALVEDPLPVKEETTAEKQNASAMFSGPTLYGYAVANDRILVRIGKQAFCIGPE